MSEPNTVHYIQTEAIFDGVPETEEGIAPAKTVISIYKDAPRDYAMGASVYSYEKSLFKNSFFFTASARGKYYVVVGTDNRTKHASGMKITTFSGESNRPVIVSTNDVEVSKAEFRIRKLLEYVKTNVGMQNLSYDEDAEYKRIYSDIIKKAILIVIFKILATVITLTYFSKKTKEYFSSQGIIEAAK